MALVHNGLSEKFKLKNSIGRRQDPKIKNNIFKLYSNVDPPYPTAEQKLAQAWPRPSQRKQQLIRLPATLHQLTMQHARHYMAGIC